MQIRKGNLNVSSQNQKEILTNLKKCSCHFPDVLFSSDSGDDLHAGGGWVGGMTQYTVNNLACTIRKKTRVSIIVPGIDFSTLYAPLFRDGRMEKFYWPPTGEDRIGVCTGIFRSDNVPKEDIVKLVDPFPGQSIGYKNFIIESPKDFCIKIESDFDFDDSAYFFGALRARVYDDEVRKWILGVGVENIGNKLVNSKEGPPTFEQPKMTLQKLLEYGGMLVQEQENVKRVQLADKYLSSAALGDASADAINRGTFHGKAAQQVNIPVPEGSTDPYAKTSTQLLEVTMEAASTKSMVGQMIFWIENDIIA